MRNLFVLVAFTTALTTAVAEVPAPLPAPVLFPKSSLPPAAPQAPSLSTRPPSPPSVPPKPVLAPNPVPTLSPPGEISAAHPEHPAPNLTPDPAAPKFGPWTVLFDGKMLKGLRGVQKPDFLKAGWKIVDGALVLSKTIKESGRQTGGDIVTTEAFTDFEFSFEWKLLVSGNSGLIYLTKTGTGGKVLGHEFQIIDDVRNPDGLKGGPVKRTGALYGVLAPNQNKQLNDNAWNEGRLVVAGSRVEHWINNELVLSYELGSSELRKAASANKARVPVGFGTKFASPVVLLDQGEDIAFRKIKVRKLSAE